MQSEHAVNVFNTYKQEENNFTNGLCSLLRLSVHERPQFIASFMKELLDLTIHGAVDSRVRVRVLRGIQLADAELCGGSCCIRELPAASFSEMRPAKNIAAPLPPEGRTRTTSSRINELCS